MLLTRDTTEQAEGDKQRPPPQACAVLMPVWGGAFVRRFLELCLPTLLAPGNLPSLAQALSTRFVLLTRSADAAGVTAHPNWRQLEQCCHTEIATIDDLIVEGNHHAAVTLAYARALRGSGAAIRDTVFLFLVGDYLVADGSLAAALRRIQGGASGVLAGNLQIDAEAAAALIRERASPGSRELTLGARLLTGWALAHLPASTAAGIVNASLRHEIEPNRIFWSVDAQTLIGRFYLLHMIAIRPEVTEFVVGAPCDYSFIPELCPSGKVDVLTDSDEYLAVEMLPRDHGAASLQEGPLRPQTVARWLSQWTTAQHRRNGETTLVFHAGELPGNIAEAEAGAAAFVAQVRAKLSPNPQPYRNHPFWIGMMALQRAATEAGGADAGLAPLLGAAPTGSGLTARLWRLRLGLLGYPPAVSPLHPSWPDFHLAYRILRRSLRPSERILVVSASPRLWLQWLRPLCEHIEAIRPEAIAEAAFDACLWAGAPDEAATAAIDRIAPMLRPGGRLFIFLVQAPTASAATQAACARLAPALDRCGISTDCIYHVRTGAVRAWLADNLTRLIRAGRNRARLALPLVLAAGALTLSAVLAGNLMLLGRSARRPPRKDCSSILITGRRAVAGIEAAIDCAKAHGYDGPQRAGSERTGPRASHRRVLVEER
jgi:hypothetical protein